MINEILINLNFKKINNKLKIRSINENITIYSKNYINKNKSPLKIVSPKVADLDSSI